jgi:outer membrane usher protein
VVKFQVKVSHAALLKLVLASGAAVPLGSSGTLRSSGVAAPVGYEGEAFVKDLQPHDNVFSVGLLDGGHCAVVFDYSPVKGEIPTIGPLTCNESAR